MNILDEVGSPPMLPASRIERASVGAGVPDLVSELLQFTPSRTVIVAGNDIAEFGVDQSIARVARLLGAPVYGSSWQRPFYASWETVQRSTCLKRFGAPAMRRRRLSSSS